MASQCFQAVPHPPEGPVDREALRRRIAELRPELDPSSTAFQAAVLLLAALQIGQNVDRLARLTGLRRDFVARCARRLVDNGVWQGGETLCNWADGTDGVAAFWADVGVAEGKLCRRRDGDGQLHWAPPGYWWKSFNFVEKQARSTTWVRYEVPPESPAEEPLSSAPDYGVPPMTAANTGSDAPFWLAFDEADDTMPGDLPRFREERDPASVSRRSFATRSDELFPHAAWLT